MTQQKNPVLLAAKQDYNASLVRIDFGRLRALETPSDLQGMGATLQGPLAADPESFVPYLIAMDVLNYQFWDVQLDGSHSRYGLDGKVGALAMEDAFHRAWLSCLPDAKALQGLQRSLQAATALGAKVAAQGVGFMLGDIPDAAGRQALLLEVLEPTRLQAAAAALLKRCARDCALDWRDAQSLAQLFPVGYGDRYLKKAQLTLMFIAGQWAATQGTALVLDVTAAADYQLPKVLRALQLLVYDEGLARTVDSEQLIDAGSVQERAIRAATILACELLAKRFNCGIGQVDSWLWLNRNEVKQAKFHLTKTTEY